MHASDGTCDSAASSAASSSPLGSSGDKSGAGGAETDTALRVDFYVLEEVSLPARLRLACRLAEKAYLNGQSALVCLPDAEQLKAFDELLWTFMDGSFVPHDLLGTDPVGSDAPVLLSAGLAPQSNIDVLINLDSNIPACLQQTRRVAEIIDGDGARRQAGRARFKAYRDLGIQPATHNIRAE